jgi:hypothetical protein
MAAHYYGKKGLATTTFGGGAGLNGKLHAGNSRTQISGCSGEAEEVSKGVRDGQKREIDIGTKRK